MSEKKAGPRVTIIEPEPQSHNNIFDGNSRGNPPSFSLSSLLKVGSPKIREQEQLQPIVSSFWTFNVDFIDLPPIRFDQDEPPSWGKIVKENILQPFLPKNPTILQHFVSTFQVEDEKYQHQRRRSFMAGTEEPESPIKLLSEKLTGDAAHADRIQKLLGEMKKRLDKKSMQAIKPSIAKKFELQSLEHYRIFELRKKFLENKESEQDLVCHRLYDLNLSHDKPLREEDFFNLYDNDADHQSESKTPDKVEPKSVGFHYTLMHKYSASPSIVIPSLKETVHINHRTEMNEELISRKHMRRRSCCCTLCGGLPELEKKTVRFVGETRARVNPGTTTSISEIKTVNEVNKKSKTNKVVKQVSSALLLGKASRDKERLSAISVGLEKNKSNNLSSASKGKSPNPMSQRKSFDFNLGVHEFPRQEPYDQHLKVDIEKIEEYNRPRTPCKPHKQIDMLIPSRTQKHQQQWSKLDIDYETYSKETENSISSQRESVRKSKQFKLDLAPEVRQPSRRTSKHLETLSPKTPDSKGKFESEPLAPYRASRVNEEDIKRRRSKKDITSMKTAIPLSRSPDLINNETSISAKRHYRAEKSLDIPRLLEKNSSMRSRDSVSITIKINKIQDSDQTRDLQIQEAPELSAPIEEAVQPIEEDPRESPRLESVLSVESTNNDEASPKLIKISEVPCDDVKKEDGSQKRLRKLKIRTVEPKIVGAAVTVESKLTRKGTMPRIVETTALKGDAKPQNNPLSPKRLDSIDTSDTINDGFKSAKFNNPLRLVAEENTSTSNEKQVETQISSFRIKTSKMEKFSKPLYINSGAKTARYNTTRADKVDCLISARDYKPVRQQKQQKDKMSPLYKLNSPNLKTHWMDEAGSSTIPFSVSSGKGDFSADNNLEERIKTEFYTSETSFTRNKYETLNISPFSKECYTSKDIVDGVNINNLDPLISLKIKQKKFKKYALNRKPATISKKEIWDTYGSLSARLTPRLFKIGPTPAASALLSNTAKGARMKSQSVIKIQLF